MLANTTLYNIMDTFTIVADTEWVDNRTPVQRLKDEYCDLHKDVYGVKGRWIYSQDLTEQELKEKIDILFEQGKIVWAEERAREEANDKKAIEQIKKTIEIGAGTLENALKWLHDANNTDGDDGYLGYQLGCSYMFIYNLRKNGLPN
jgi:hypothetical protein